MINLITDNKRIMKVIKHDKLNEKVDLNNHIVIKIEEDITVNGKTFSSDENELIVAEIKKIRDNDIDNRNLQIETNISIQDITGVEDLARLKGFRIAKSADSNRWEDYIIAPGYSRKRLDIDTFLNRVYDIDSFIQDEVRLALDKMNMYNQLKDESKDELLKMLVKLLAENSELKDEIEILSDSFVDLWKEQYYES
mgnify:FL=1